MKLPILVCDLCGTSVDTDDPAWSSRGGEYRHACGGAGVIGKAVLRRTPDQERAIQEETRDFLEVGKQIEFEAREQAAVTRFGGGTRRNRR